MVGAMSFAAPSRGQDRGTMYGTYSGMSFGLVAIAVLSVIALAVMASPLIAVVVAAIIGVFMLIGMSFLRQRSAAEDQTEGGASDTHAPGPARRRRGHRRPHGEPASGEG
jgi:FtsH-binding integral membrane protein